MEVAAIKTVQEVIQLRSKRAVAVRNEFQLQVAFKPLSLCTPFQEPREFLDLQQAAFHAQDPIAAHSLGNQCARRRQLLNAGPLGHVLVLVRGLIDKNFHAFYVAKSRVNARLDCGPIQASVPSAKRRDCDGLDMPLAQDALQVLQARFHPLDTRRASPMIFGRKIDDPARPFELPRIGHKHLPDLHLLRLAGGCVELKIRAESFLEHQGNALAHHTHGVDGIHQRLNAGLKQVALGIRNHQKYQLGLVCTGISKSSV